MDDVVVQSIGYLAGLGTTVSFFPQMVRVIKTQCVNDLSLPMFLIHSSGASLWVVYGVFIDNIIIVLFNALTLFFNLIILSVFVRSHCKKPTVPDYTLDAEV